MLEATERVFYSKDWITLIFLLIFTLLVLVKYHYSDRLSRLYSLLMSRNYLAIYSKNSPVLLNTFHLYFAIIQVFIFSLTIFVGIKANNSIAKEFELPYFLNILAGVFIFIVLRYFIGKLLSILFKMEKEHEFITYLKMSYLSNFCLFITPVLVIIMYVFYNSTAAAVVVTVMAVSVLFMYYVLIIKNNQKLIYNNLFYFILYLCALEIAPLVYLYKLFII